MDEKLKTTKSPVYVKLMTGEDAFYYVKVFKVVEQTESSITKKYYYNACGNIMIPDFSRAYKINPNKDYLLEVFYMLPDQSLARNFVIAIYNEDGKAVETQNYIWQVDVNENDEFYPNSELLDSSKLVYKRFKDEKYFRCGLVSIAQLSTLSNDTTKYFVIKLSQTKLSYIIYEWFNGEQLTDNIYDFCEAMYKKLSTESFKLYKESHDRAMIPRNVPISSVFDEKVNTIKVILDSELVSQN